MQKSRVSIVLVVLLLAGCAGTEPASTPSAPPVSPASPAASSAAPAGQAFPLTIHRQGGFAGFDDRAEIAADGTVVVTRRGQSPAKVTLPAATVEELGRLVTSPEFTVESVPSPTAVCNDGFEYEVVSPGSRLVVQDCGTSHGATVDRVLAVATGLFSR
ncbi:hypothetical protein [Actinoplanes subglobosus]|uniref:Lipoprotein n=1 Tax=Actinoplanes subglobosus TaxID=1547892 RepID=A0ABV8J3L4_9ACTN